MGNPKQPSRKIATLEIGQTSFTEHLEPLINFWEIGTNVFVNNQEKYLFGPTVRLSARLSVVLLFLIFCMQLRFKKTKPSFREKKNFLSLKWLIGGILRPIKINILKFFRARSLDFQKFYLTTCIKSDCFGF